MLLSADTKGRFGNELFVTTTALIRAQLTNRPVMLNPQLLKAKKKRQILKLPCIHRALRLPMPHMCPGCTEISQRFGTIGAMLAILAVAVSSSSSPRRALLTLTLDTTRT